MPDVRRYREVGFMTHLAHPHADTNQKGNMDTIYTMDEGSEAERPETSHEKYHVTRSDLALMTRDELERAYVSLVREYYNKLQAVRTLERYVADLEERVDILEAEKSGESV
jgi:hypothetical protein